MGATLVCVFHQGERGQDMAKPFPSQNKKICTSDKTCYVCYIEGCWALPKMPRCYNGQWPLFIESRNSLGPRQEVVVVGMTLARCHLEPQKERGERL